MLLETLNTRKPRRIRDLHGIGGTLERRIIVQLGGGDEQIALKVITANPYALIDVEGIGFLKADKIALKDFDLGADDARRHEAGNQHILGERGPLPWHEYRRRRRELGLVNPSLELDGVTEDSGLVWLPGELMAERFLAGWMADLHHAQRIEGQQTAHWYGRTLEPVAGLDDMQSNAARTALENPYRVMALTGGAGTGKTHVIAAIAKLAAERGLKTHVMAFAGKAADRAREALGLAGAPGQASTIHRALGLGRDGANGMPDEVGADVVVLDEASMVPNWLFAMLVMSLKPGARLVIVGDEAQLPPIGYGAPFNDYLALKLLCVNLERNYRQRDQQAILHVATAVRERREPPNEALAARCITLQAGLELTDLNNAIKAEVSQYAPADWDAWQAITFKNVVRQQLNAGCQGILNPNGEFVLSYMAWELPEEHRRTEIRVGDKVVVTKNDYVFDIFNGQIGMVIGVSKRVVKYNPDTHQTMVLAPDTASSGDLTDGVLLEMRGSARWLPLDIARENLQLGYCLTCHKAQGSGWQTVYVIQPEAVQGDPNRWHYTAMTRAENRLGVFTLMSFEAYWANATRRENRRDSSLFNRVREVLK